MNLSKIGGGKFEKSMLSVLKGYWVPLIKHGYLEVL
jgi:hypothetical protein